MREGQEKRLIFAIFEKFVKFMHIGSDGEASCNVVIPDGVEHFRGQAGGDDSHGVLKPLHIPNL